MIEGTVPTRYLAYKEARVVGGVDIAWVGINAQEQLPLVHVNRAVYLRDPEVPVIKLLTTHAHLGSSGVLALLLFRSIKYAAYQQVHGLFEDMCFFLMFD